MKKVLGVFLGLIALIIVGIIALFALPNAGTGPVNDAAQSAKAAAANAVMDVSGVKDQVKGAIDTHRDDIAAATGLSADAVDAAIEDLNIDGWQAAPLPADAVEAGSVDGGSLGFDGSLTLYEDPTYVTLNAFGQNLTLSVPASAQEHLSSLALAL